MTRYDAIVVGGGIAGLAAAYELTRAGLRPLVLEARGYVGGLIAGATLADVPIDIGAEAWAVRRPEVGELVEELGLTVQAPGGASWVYGADGRAVRMPARAMLGIPQQPADRDVVEALGPVDAARASRDMTMAMSDDDARRLGSGDLAALVSERMGGATLEKLVRPVAGGIHSADPAQLSVAAVLPGLPEALVEHRSLARAIGALRERAPQGPPVATVEGGMALLTRTLAESVVAAGGAVRTRWGARSLRRARPGHAAVPGDRTAEAAPRWELTAAPTRPAADPSAEPEPAGEPEVLTSSRLILAAGPAVAERLLAGALESAAGPRGAAGPSAPDPAGPSSTPSASSEPSAPSATPAPLPRLELTPGAPITHLTLALDAPALDAAPRGSGLLVAPGAPGVGAKALTHLTVKGPWVAAAARAAGHPHRHVLRLSYGRTGDPPPQVGVADALADAATLLGVPLAEDAVGGHLLVRWSGALSPATPAARATARALDARVRDDDAFAGLRLAGAWVAGTGLAAIVPHARDAARELARR